MRTTSLQEVCAMIPDGASVMIGGFMGVGSPERLIDELVRQGKRRLTVIANDTAWPGRGIGKLVDAGLVSRTIASHIGLNPETQRQMIAGSMEVDLVPQGTLIERIRAAGYGLVQGDLIPGVAGIGTAILDAGGIPFASVSVAGATEVLPPARAAAVLAILEDSAKQISAHAHEILLTR